MLRLPPRFTRTDTLFPYTTLFRSDAARIVQVVGDIGVTGNYQTIANKEARQANLWRRVTVGLFACGLAMAGFTFYKFYHEPVSSSNTLAIAVRQIGRASCRERVCQYV